MNSVNTHSSDILQEERKFLIELDITQYDDDSSDTVSKVYNSHVNSIEFYSSSNVCV